MYDSRHILIICAYSAGSSGSDGKELIRRGGTVVAPLYVKCSIRIYKACQYTLVGMYKVYAYVYVSVSVSYQFISLAE